ncbi:MAG: hypothetical protein KJO76_09400 [Gammaproteobacteria bacterium]|nr:hypothetical protein [Gammaproteobacteria bacterium]NND36628.1 hypothetical protein [Gammaproteobacteria bacterium]
MLRGSENQAKLTRYESDLQTAADGPLRVAPWRCDLAAKPLPYAPGARLRFPKPAVLDFTAVDGSRNVETAR